MKPRRRVADFKLEVGDSVVPVDGGVDVVVFEP